MRAAFLFTLTERVNGAVQVRQVPVVVRDEVFLVVELALNVVLVVRIEVLLEEA